MGAGMKVTIELELAEKISGYLQSRPFREVDALVHDLANQVNQSIVDARKSQDGGGEE